MAHRFSRPGEPEHDPVFSTRHDVRPAKEPESPPTELLIAVPTPYPAQWTQPIEPILFPKLRIRLAEFPYATLFYAPETAHLGDLMRIRYGYTEAQRISPSYWLF